MEGARRKEQKSELIRQGGRIADDSRFSASVLLAPPATALRRLSDEVSAADGSDLAARTDLVNLLCLELSSIKWYSVPARLYMSAMARRLETLAPACMPAGTLKSRLAAAVSEELRVLHLALAAKPVSDSAGAAVPKLFIQAAEQAAASADCNVASSGGLLCAMPHRSPGRTPGRAALSAARPPTEAAAAAAAADDVVVVLVSTTQPKDVPMLDLTAD